MKKKIGWILTVVFTTLFIYVMIYISDFITFIISLGLASLVVGSVYLCTYLLDENE